MYALPTISIRGLGDKMTDEEFYQFCIDNKGLRIERDSKGNIVVMSPTNSKSGFYESQLIGSLVIWNKIHNNGFVFSSSAGFTLPDNSVRSPDASWVSKEVWDSTPEKEKNRFARITPEFIAEIRSQSDNLNQLKEKMESWIKNGVKLAWLIDPINQNTLLYRSDSSMEIIEGFDKKLSGEDILEGFEFDLTFLTD